MTLEGAAAKMRDDRHSVQKRVKALDTLKEIRDNLIQVRKGL